MIATGESVTWSKRDKDGNLWSVDITYDPSRMEPYRYRARSGVTNRKRDFASQEKAENCLRWKGYSLGEVPLPLDWKPKPYQVGM